MFSHNLAVTLCSWTSLHPVSVFSLGKKKNISLKIKPVSRHLFAPFCRTNKIYIKFVFCLLSKNGVLWIFSGALYIAPRTPANIFSIQWSRFLRRGGWLEMCNIIVLWCLEFCPVLLTSALRISSQENYFWKQQKIRCQENIQGSTSSGFERFKNRFCHKCASQNKISNITQELSSQQVIFSDKLNSTG